LRILTLFRGAPACVDCDTEYFNGVEWKRISEYTEGDKVLQYNDDGSSELVSPLEYHKYKEDNLYLIQTQGVSQCVSLDHNLVYISSKGNINKKVFSDVYKQHLKNNHGFRGKFITTFNTYGNENSELNEFELRLTVAICADGNYPRDTNRCRIRIKKQRKIERIRFLLNKCNIDFEEKIYNETNVEGYINFMFKSPLRIKNFPHNWYNLSRKCLDIISDECIKWDGSINKQDNSIAYYTTNKQDADFIQYVFSSTGYKSGISIDEREDKPITYRVSKCSYNLVGISTKGREEYKDKIIKEYKTLDGHKYCFTVPSGMLVLRRDGHINITGNCGKSTFIKDNNLEQYALSADNIRLLLQSPIMTTDGRYGISQKNDKKVWELLFDILEQRMIRGEFVVVDATNSKTVELNRYKSMAETYRYRIICVDMTDVPIEVCKERNQNRKPDYKVVHDFVIDNMYARFESQKISSGVKAIKPEEFWDTITYSPLDFSNYKKIHHIGDLHGCNTVLQEYLGGELKEDELYVFVGDYVDRGIENVELLNYLFSVMDKLNVIFLQGNHECLAKGTEILTKDGWKVIENITKEDVVAQYDLISKEISFDNPIETIKKESNTIINFNSHNIRHKVTPNHDIIYKGEKVKAKDLLNKHNLEERDFTLWGYTNDNVVNIEDDWIRLLTWVIMDSTIVDNIKGNPNSIKKRIQFKFSKERKIKSVKQLLDRMDIPYTFQKAKMSDLNRVQPYYIRIYGEYARDIFNKIHNERLIPNEWKYFNQRQVSIFLDTLIKSDGYLKANNIEWRTINSQNIDIVQEMCVKNGIICKYDYKEGSGFSNGKYQYVASIFYYGSVNHPVTVTEEEYNNLTYCCTMSKGTLITRLDGRVIITGNCHLWDYSNDMPTKSKEFEQVTKRELNKLQIDKKKLRIFYRKLRQLAYYTYNNKVVVVTHGGISTIPERFEFLATEQLIKGVGEYKEMEMVNGRFLNSTPNNYYQIHGHRNVADSPIQINERCFCLEGKCEFGGYLRIVTLDDKGFNTIEVKNNIFKPIEEKIESIKSEEIVVSNMELIEKLRANRYVRESKFGHISSFNFTKDAFYKNIWDEQTIKARGLFFNIETGEVVARSYEKFFNVNQRENVKLDNLKNVFQFPVTAWVKYNGFLGLVGYDSSRDELLISSKSNPNSEFAGYFRDIFNDTLTLDQQSEIKEYLKEQKSTLVFEVIDPTNDPHMIKYIFPHLVLLEIVENDINEPKKKSYEEIQLFSNKYNIPLKVKAKILDNWREFYQWYEEVTADDYKYKGQYIEGFVLEDNVGFMTKIKLQYYGFWKHMRSVKEDVSRNGYTKYTSSLATPLANEFYGWLRHQTKEVLRKDIITLREMFYTEKGEYNN